MVTREECADLSNAVIDFSTPEGWTMLENTETGTGLAVAVYARDANNDSKFDDYVVAFRATEISSINDLFNDLQIGLDQVPTQYNDAVDFYEQFKQNNPNFESNNNNNVVFTGYSLGSALAQLMGATYESTPDSHYSETHAFNGPGTNHLLDNLNLDNNIEYTTVNNYINMSDVIGNLAETQLLNLFPIGKHVGNINYLSPAPLGDSFLGSHRVYDTEPIDTSAIADWTFRDAYSLWWFDKDNTTTSKGDLDPTGLTPSHQNLYDAVTKVLQLEISDEALRYKTTKNLGFSIKGEIAVDNAESNLIIGSVGEDYLFGNEGNDTIDGGYGWDYLQGGEGNDTYSFFSGSGFDTVVDGEGENDTFKFDSTVSKNDIVLFAIGGDIIVDYGEYAYQDQIVLKNQNTGRFELSNGMYLDEADINQIVQDITTYTVDNNIELTEISDIKDNTNLAAIVTNAWHA